MTTTMTATTITTATLMADGAAAPGLDGPAWDEWLDVAALHRLMSWLSPSFPVGAFSYSHGLEWAIEDGTVTSTPELTLWVADILRHGAGRSDAILFAHAWDAAMCDDGAALAEIAALAVAFQPSAERRLESLSQGRAFLLALRAAWPAPALEHLLPFVDGEDGTAYPVAVALAAAVHGVPRGAAINAYLHAFAANIISAGLRAVPLGQTDGQRIIAGLGPIVHEVVEAVKDRPLDALGGAVFRADIASMKHETQYTRLFRS
ncbi:urease accessory protein UreF [Kaistia dalseonensis]|uniref:Urease accessory protein UreF n=1 Tax=Kaistia dalseonensis TaxID=410840 RepID=A0ABU0H5C5_9HYPH|nr:urease accessory protein UreF [Kaistia dalseonensis]MCX5494652.1 urease accessory protein UreF [Kaistia dalseonensis]MDQ0437232.1 urease accessory protein [Kaistia dalseonensis]